VRADTSLYADLSLYDYGQDGFPHPRDIEIPKGVVKRVNVPQSLYDSWWILLEFDSEQSRENFMEFPPPTWRRAHFAIRPQEFYDKWATA
jgi:hypothetical protein